MKGPASGSLLRGDLHVSAKSLDWCSEDTPTHYEIVLSLGILPIHGVIVLLVRCATVSVEINDQWPLFSQVIVIALWDIDSVCSSFISRNYSMRSCVAVVANAMWYACTISVLAA